MGSQHLPVWPCPAQPHCGRRGCGSHVGSPAEWDQRPAPRTAHVHLRLQGPFADAEPSAASVGPPAHHGPVLAPPRPPLSLGAPPGLPSTFLFPGLSRPFRPAHLSVPCVTPSVRGPRSLTAVSGRAEPRTGDSVPARPHALCVPRAFVSHAGRRAGRRPMAGPARVRARGGACVRQARDEEEPDGRGRTPASPGPPCPEAAAAPCDLGPEPLLLRVPSPPALLYWSRFEPRSFVSWLTTRTRRPHRNHVTSPGREFRFAAPSEGRLVSVTVAPGTCWPQESRPQAQTWRTPREGPSSPGRLWGPGMAGGHLGHLTSRRGPQARSHSREQRAAGHRDL